MGRQSKGNHEQRKGPKSSTMSDQLSKLKLKVKPFEPESRTPEVLETEQDVKTDSELFRNEFSGIQKLGGDERVDLHKQQRLASARRRAERKQTAMWPTLAKVKQIKVINSVPSWTQMTPKNKDSDSLVRRLQSVVKSVPKAAAEPEKAVTKPKTLVLTPSTSINSTILAEDGKHYCSWDIAGLEPQVEFDGIDSVDLIIGLDFGTAYTKVVVQEPGSQRAWAIPFSSDKSNPFLLSSIIHCSGDTYQLKCSDKKISNLKVPLLTGEADLAQISHTVAFLALVLRHAKAWILSNLMDELPGEPVWAVNIGLPAQNLEDKELIKVFEQMLLSAFLMSDGVEDELTVRDVKCSQEAIQKQVDEGAVEFSMGSNVFVSQDQISVLPELAAQVFGYLSSDMWDRSQPKFMLVDIGGGTVDAAIFNVTKREDGLRFSFLRSAVRKLGVHFVHDRRIHWIISELELLPNTKALKEQLIRLISDNITPAVIPQSVEKYLSEVQHISGSVDDECYGKFARMLWDDLVGVVKSKLDPISSQWTNLPLILCGGGRKFELYNKFFDSCSKNTSTSVEFNRLDMPKPNKLIAPGIGEAEYQRLSVAYGLSFDGLGEVITADALKDKYIKQPTRNFRDRFVSKDEM